MRRSRLEALIAVCPPPASPVTYGEIIRYQELHNTLLPDDFLSLTRAYGEGEFNGAIQLKTPFSPVLTRNCFTQSKARNLDIRPIQHILSDTLEINPRLNDFHIWASSRNQDTFFWVQTNQNTDEYVIAIYNEAENEWEAHSLTFADFLAQLLDGHLETEMVSLICIDPPVSFTPTYKNDDYLKPH